MCSRRTRRIPSLKATLMMQRALLALSLLAVLPGAATNGHESVEKMEGELGAFLGEPKFEMRQIFTGGRLPNVVVATDGTVLAAWGWGQVRVRRSEDGGTTWGPEIAVGKGLLSGGVTVDEKTGDILLFTEAKQSGLDRREPRLAEIAVFNRLTTVWAMYEAAQRTTSISL